jgi:hypothetical protein
MNPIITGILIFCKKLLSTEIVRAGCPAAAWLGGTIPSLGNGLSRVKNPIGLTGFDV